MHYGETYTYNYTCNKDVIIHGNRTEVVNDLEISKTNDSKNGVIYGWVINKCGKPIHNAVVKILSETYKSIQNANTDCNGQYVIMGIPMNQTCKAITTAPKHNLSDEIEFCIKEQSTIKIDFMLSHICCNASKAIVGSVLNQLNCRPISGAQVVLYKEGDRVEHFMSVTDTNEDGKFAFTKLVIGRYIVKIRMNGYFSRQYKVMISRCEQIKNQITLLCPDSSGLRGTVSGVITDQDHKPIPEADVILYKTENNGVMIPMAYTQTNNSGVYLFDNVETGIYRISAK